MNDISDFFRRVIPPNLDQLDVDWIDSLENLPVYLRALALMPQMRLPKKMFLMFHTCDTDDELVQRLKTPMSPTRGLSIGMDKDVGYEVRFEIGQPFDLCMHGAVLADLIDGVGWRQPLRRLWNSGSRFLIMQLPWLEHPLFAPSWHEHPS